MNNNIILVYPLGVQRDGVAYTAQVMNRRLGRSVNGVRLHAVYIRVRYCVSNVYENVFVGRCTELVGYDNRRVTRSEARRGMYNRICFKLHHYCTFIYIFTNIVSNNRNFVSIAEQEIADAGK